MIFSVSRTAKKPTTSKLVVAIILIVLGDRCLIIESRARPPKNAASALLVTSAPTAPSQTLTSARYLEGCPTENFAADVAAVIWPTSPHSEKKTAEKATKAPLNTLGGGVSREGFGFNQSTVATPKKLIAVTPATMKRGK